MIVQIEQIEQALQAPVMDAVIALSERVQTLQDKPEGRIYTAYRAIDQTLRQLRQLGWPLGSLKQNSTPRQGFNLEC